MRLRVTLSIDLTRRRDRDQQPAPEVAGGPEIYDVSSANVTHADPHPEPDRPIGFRREDSR